MSKYEYIVKELNHDSSFCESLEKQLNEGLFDWEFLQLFEFKGTVMLLFRRVK